MVVDYNQTIAHVYKLVQQAMLLFLFFLSFPSIISSSLLSFLCCLIAQAVSVRPLYSNGDWPQLHVSLPSFWAQKYSSRHAWRHGVAKGVSPSDLFELFLSLKWHHRDPA